MNLPKILQTSVRCLLPIAVMMPMSQAVAQTELYWDANPSEADTQDSAPGSTSTWNLSGNNWYNKDNQTNVSWSSVNDSIDGAFAIFGNGVGTGSEGIRDISVAETINLVGMSINAPVVYRFSGPGTLNFRDGSTIAISDGATTAGTQIFFNSNITGKDLFISVQGTTDEYVTLNNNKDWTGTLTLGGTGQLFVQANGGTTLNDLSTIYVLNGSTLALAGTSQTYTPDIWIAGTGPNNRGAIRISTTNMTLTGRIMLMADAMISTQDSGGTPMTGYLSAGIGEVAPGSTFTKSGSGELFIRGASNYTGQTVVSPVGATDTGGTLILDFANSSTVQNLLYNGVSANMLRLAGNSAGSISALTVSGKDGTNNSQTFAGVEVTNLAQIVATSGNGGSVTLDLGNVSKAAPGSFLRITAPENGEIRVSNSGSVLPFASYESGGTVSWAGIDSGKLVTFTGNLAYSTGSNVSALPGYNTNSHLRISDSSTGEIALANGTTGLGSISMVDTGSARTVAVAANETIHFANAGGIQLLSNAKQLTVGAAPGVGTITAGAGAADLYLSNFSADQALVINSTIADNSTGSVRLMVNGGGTVSLA